LGAHPGVRGAVLESAGRAHLHVLVAGRQAVHPALGGPVVHTEVLAAHRAAVRAGLAAAVVVAADHQRGGRAATLRTGERPAGHAAESAPRGERRAAPLAGFEPPLGALHQHGRLDELQRMYHRLHLTASDPLGAAATSASTGTPADRSYTSVSTTASSTPAPARSTTRAASRPTGCTASRVAPGFATPSRTGMGNSTGSSPISGRASPPVPLSLRE